MKKASLLVLAMTFTIICYAQDNPKQKEVGITMSNLNSFGLTFKIGKSTALWRINTLFIAGGESEEVADTTRVSFKSNGVNVQMGREWRSLVTDKFVLRYGVDFKFIYSHSERVRFDTGTFRDSENFRTTYRYGFNIVLGMNYLITDRIFIGGELLPSLLFETGEATEFNLFTGETEQKDISGYSYGFDSGSVLLTFGFRF